MCEESSIDLCISGPGHDADLDVESDNKALTWVWYGDMALQRAFDDALIALHGPRQLCADFPSWLQLNLLAAVPRRHGSTHSV